MRTLRHCLALAAVLLTAPAMPAAATTYIGTLGYWSFASDGSLSTEWAIPDFVGSSFITIVDSSPFITIDLYKGGTCIDGTCSGEHLFSYAGPQTDSWESNVNVAIMNSLSPGAPWLPGSYFLAIDPPTTTTPLPAALPLFAGGLGALGFLGWRRKRKVAASTTAACVR